MAELTTTTKTGVRIYQYGQDGPFYLHEPYAIEDRPLAWQTRGLQQTASGYGRKLTSTRCVRLADGRIRRVYVTIFGNAGSAWITVDGFRVHVRNFD